jgi:hypothetical protein
MDQNREDYAEPRPPRPVWGSEPRHVAIVLLTLAVIVGLVVAAILGREIIFPVKPDFSGAVR